MLRPWLQPWVYSMIARAALLVGIESPFIWALFMRVFSAAVGFLSLMLLLSAFRSKMSEAAFRIACIASATLWFLPALHARLSSENLSGSIFFIALSLLLLVEPGPLIAAGAGVLLGLSFEVRYQCGFMILGLLAWLLAYRRLKGLGLAWLLTGCLGAVAFGSCMDRWGYGVWTLAPFSYFKYNLVENHVADIDTQPFWDFFRSSFTETWPPLGLLALLAMIAAWMRLPKSPLTWVCVPLFVVHSLIGHKELRFLFPLVHAMPLFLAFALEGKPLAFLSSRTGRFLAFAMIGDNAVALAALCLLPAWMPAVFYADVYRHARATPGAFHLYYRQKNPYEVLGTSLFYYRPPNLELSSLQSFEELRQLIANSDSPIWYFDTQVPLPDDSGVGSLCRVTDSTLPPALLKVASLRPLTARMSNWILYECAK
jgi:phosphatidylinositol glycan class B